MIFYRPKSLEEIQKVLPLDKYRLHHVPGCKIGWADYEALKRDFPFLSSLKDGEVDHWILQEFSYISETQFELGELRNTKIPTTENQKFGYRQTNFSSEHQEFQGRGDVMEVFDLQGKLAGLIDRKGIGISKKKLTENKELLERFTREGNPEKIETKNLSNGLAYLGEALIEAAAMKVTQRVFDWINEKKDFDLPFPPLNPLVRAPLQTIEGYFVLQLPFQLKAGKFGAYPAAMYARQAHVGRVWTGKIFTAKVNIKQSDFFFALCDGGTVRIRIPELERLVEKIKGGPNLLQYQVGLDLVERIRSGEEEVLKKTIDEVLAPLGNISQPMPISFVSFEEAFESLLKIINSDVIRFHRFVECIWFVIRNYPELADKNRSRIQEIGEKLLAVSSSVLDHDDSFRPLRRWGILLLPMFPEKLRLQIWKRESKRWFQEPEILAKTAVLLPFEEIEESLPRLYALGGGWLRNEVRALLQHRGSGDPRYSTWKAMEAWWQTKGWHPKPLPLTKQKQVRAVFWVSWLRTFGFIWVR